MRGLVGLIFIISCMVATAASEQCGQQAGGSICPGGLCCSRFGWCGNTAAYCDPAQGCQSNCWGRIATATAAPSDGKSAYDVRATYDYYRPEQHNEKIALRSVVDGA